MANPEEWGGGVAAFYHARLPRQFMVVFRSAKARQRLTTTSHEAFDMVLRARVLSRSERRPSALHSLNHAHFGGAGDDASQLEARLLVERAVLFGSPFLAAGNDEHGEVEELPRE